MRLIPLLLCLSLAACAGVTLPGEQPAPASAGFTPSVTAAPSGQAASSVDPAPGSPQERMQQAKVDCWMKVEHQKGLRGIDQRIGFVDKCVAEQLKAQP
jgi:hypothetical protein